MGTLDLVIGLLVVRPKILTEVNYPCHTTRRVITPRGGGVVTLLHSTKARGKGATCVDSALSPKSCEDF
eukprot:scaffold4109_cov133-Isochrysis_galbana.AAC.3